MPAWLVRAGYDRRLSEATEAKSAVAIGWDVGDLSGVKTRAEIRERLLKAGEVPANGIKNAVGNIGRFVLDMKVGDDVLTFDRDRRQYLVGKVVSGYLYDPTVFGPEYEHVRRVKWEGRVDRDDLSAAARNSLGSTLTVFSASDHIGEVRALLTGKPAPAPEPGAGTAEEADEVPFHDEVEERADEFIADLVGRLDGHAMQSLVAHLLRAMGYHTHESPRGPDGGIDIRASPDKLLLADPVIRVQVKHRKDAAGRGEIQALRGAMGDGTRGLFISTGGFSREAQMEADRSNQPLNLVDGDRFVELLKEHYHHLSQEARDLVPLKRVWIPLRT